MVLTCRGFAGGRVGRQSTDVRARRHAARRRGRCEHNVYRGITRFFARGAASGTNFGMIDRGSAAATLAAATVPRTVAADISLDGACPANGCRGLRQARATGLAFALAMHVGGVSRDPRRNSFDGMHPARREGCSRRVERRGSPAGAKPFIRRTPAICAHPWRAFPYPPSARARPVRFWP